MRIGGQPAVNNSPHPVPADIAFVAAPRQRALPQPAHLGAKQEERRVVQRHPVIPVVPCDHRAQPLAHLGNGVVQALAQLGFHLTELGLQPLPHRLPPHHKPSALFALAANMRKAEKGEGLGLPFTAPLAVSCRKAAELHQPGLVGMQFQSELAHPGRKLRPELLGF